MQIYFYALPDFHISISFNQKGVIITVQCSSSVHMTQAHLIYDFPCFTNVNRSTSPENDEVCSVGSDQRSRGSREQWKVEQSQFKVILRQAQNGWSLSREKYTIGEQISPMAPTHILILLHISNVFSILFDKQKIKNIGK